MWIEKKMTECANLIHLKSLKEVSWNTVTSFFSFTQSTIRIAQQDDYTGQPVKTAAQVTLKDFMIYYVRLLQLITLDFMQAQKRLVSIATLTLYSFLLLHYVLILNLKIWTGCLLLLGFIAKK